MTDAVVAEAVVAEAVVAEAAVTDAGVAEGVGTEAVAAHLTTATGRWFRQRFSRSGGRDRGDVPGWVLVTLMTAALVSALLALAGPLLQRLFTDAVNSVTGG